MIIHGKYEVCPNPKGFSLPRCRHGWKQSLWAAGEASGGSGKAGVDQIRGRVPESVGLPTYIYIYVFISDYVCIYIYICIYIYTHNQI